MTCKLTMKLLKREQEAAAKKAAAEQSASTADKAEAFERALAAFESEFGTFDDLLAEGDAAACAAEPAPADGGHC